MLPINTPSKEMLDALMLKGIKEEDLLAVIRLDLDRDGNFGEAFLALDMTARRIVSYAAGEVQLYPMATFKDQYIDNFTSTNRILVVSYPAPLKKRVRRRRKPLTSRDVRSIGRPVRRLCLAIVPMPASGGFLLL